MDEEQMASYEISFLTREEGDFQALLKHLSDYEAEIVSESGLNKIKLAYPIKNHEEAYFGYLNFRMDRGEVVKLERALKLDSKIIRFLIVRGLPKGAIVRREEYPRAREIGPVSEAPKAGISNEALEKKLEEILK
ncbi:MAG: 30S ribosomal protein S6 [Candidatus Colwellbacteria bacterium]|nr:30S ribosomal protein S6 [Candidatus Colwellbacteria bacterium]